jgi:hypothetical protein
MVIPTTYKVGYSGGGRQEDSRSEPSPGKSTTPDLKNKLKQKDWGHSAEFKLQY